MARRSRKETLQSKIDVAEAKIAELQEKTVALQQEIDKYNDELVDIEKAEKEKADKAAMDELVKAIKKSGKSYDEVMTFLDQE